jgi:hypothetical protein
MVVQFLLLIIAGIGFFVKINQDRGAVLKTIEDNVTRAKEDADKKLYEAKEDADKKLYEAKEEGDKKRARIYERFDQYKLEVKKDFKEMQETMENKFVKTKVCEVVHNSATREMSEIKSDVKLIYEELRKLNEKLLDGKK